jgi:hypothetical protein
VSAARRGNQRGDFVGTDLAVVVTAESARVVIEVHVLELASVLVYGVGHRTADFRHGGSAVGCRERKYFLVAHLLVCSTGFGDGDHVVAEPA